MKTRLSGVLVACLVASSCSSDTPSAGAAETAPRISASTGVTCQWWSEEQMEGMNSNSPPPKATEVMIDHWEYTDPIGVPHPDSVDFVVDIRNDGSAPVRELEARMSARWSVGAISDEASATWGESSIVESVPDIRLEPGETRQLRVPIELSGEMSRLHAEDRWPFSVKLTLEVLQAGRATSLLREETEFPIRPGD